MRKVVKAVTAVFLSAAVMLVCFSNSVFADTAKGSAYTANQYVAGRLDVIFSEYPVGSYFSFDGNACTHHNTGTCSYYGGCNCRSYFYDSETGKTIKLNSIQCMGFAHYCFYKIFGFIDRSEYDASLYYSLGEISSASMTAANCRNLILQASAGAHIRVANKHSMVYLSGNSEGFTVLHCNADGHCGISIKYWTWEEFANNFRSYGIAYVHMPVNYPGTSSNCVVSTSSPYYYPGSGVTFNWTAVQGVQNYKLAVTSCTDLSKTAVYSSLTGLTKTINDTNLFTAGSVYRADIYAGGSTSPGSSAYFYIAPSRSSVLGRTVGSGSYTLKNSRTSAYAYTSGNSDGDPVKTGNFSGSTGQLFCFEYFGNGLYKIHLGSPDSNVLLTVGSGSMGAVSAGNTICAYNENDSLVNRQLFYVSQYSGGFAVEPISCPGTVVSVNSANGELILANQTQTSYGTWYFCDTGGNIIDPTQTSGFITGIYRITTDSTSLNIRSGPGTGYERVGSVDKGASVTVTAIDGEWGYISYSGVSGWICLNYATCTASLVSSISVVSGPNKTVYQTGENLDTTGLVIRINNSDGASSEIYSGFDCSYDFSTAGDASNGYKKNVAVSYYGKTTSFTVTVTGTSLPSVVLTDAYSVNSDMQFISGISPGVTMDEFIGGFYTPYYIKVYNGDTEVSGGTIVATGMTLKLTDGNTVSQTLTVIVTGDVNGDGVSDVSDILTIQSHILGKTVLSGGILLSADCNGDGVSDVSDILTIQSAILGKSAIKPQRF